MRFVILLALLLAGCGSPAGVPAGETSGSVDLKLRLESSSDIPVWTRWGLARENGTMDGEEFLLMSREVVWVGQTMDIGQTYQVSYGYRAVYQPIYVTGMSANVEIDTDGCVDGDQWRIESKGGHDPNAPAIGFGGGSTGWRCDGMVTFRAAMSEG